MRELFAKSRLPLETIQRVWKLCDIEKTHELDRDEFVMALHMCRILAHHTGSTVPHVLPTSIVPRDKRKQILSRREQQQQQQHQHQAGLLPPSAHFSATKSAEERALVYEPSNIQFHSMSANNTPETLTSTRISEVPEQMSEDVEDDLFFAALHSGVSRDTTAAQATGSIDKVFDKIDTHVDSTKGKATLASSLSKSSLNRNQRAKSTGSMVMTSAIDSTPEDAEGGAQSPHLPQPDDADEGKKKEKKSRFRNMLDSFTGSEEKRATTPTSSAANVATDGALHSEIHAMPTETGQATKDKVKDKKTKKSHERSQSLGGLLPTEAPIAETGRKGLARQASAFEQGTSIDNRPKEKEKDKDKGKPHTNIFGIFTKKASKHMPDSAAKDGTVAEKESMPTQEALVKQLEEADRLLKVQIEERNRIEALIKNAQNTDPASKDQIVS